MNNNLNFILLCMAQRSAAQHKTEKTNKLKIRFVIITVNHVIWTVD